MVYLIQKDYYCLGNSNLKKGRSRLSEDEIAESTF